MNIPLNGRIAIIDDQWEQALPLMNVLAQQKCACQYFSGDLRYLPAEGQTLNDIRILFLDINLLDNATHSAQQLRGTLISVLNRIISPSNFPWVLIYWSRHEAEHAGLVRDIFDQVLNDRKPIVYLSQNKSDYFSMKGDKTAEFDTRINQLFAEISLRLKEEPAYRELIHWENLLHRSADKTVKDIFSAMHEHASWTNNANFLMERLGESYAGKSYKNLAPEERIRSAFQTLNNVFSDTLEYMVNNAVIAGPAELEYDPPFAGRDHIYMINKKLLLSDERQNMAYSGTVIEDSRSSGDELYKGLLNDCFNRAKVRDLHPDMGPKELNKVCSEIRGGIREFSKRIHLVVTPLCDVVQGKAINSRVIPGFLIREGMMEYIEQRSEAMFVSPRFRWDGAIYALVLNFRYFYTIVFDPQKMPEGLMALFRVRQSLLAEVQSKLARHISRQGVLFVDEV